MARLGPFWATPGRLGTKTKKWPYLGLGAPNRESKGTCLGYHPPGLVVSTCQMGPNARLAPRTGRWTPFLANLDPQPGHQSGPKWQKDRISGFLGYHPPGLVVSTRQMGPNVRLAPRTGRWDAFWANSGLKGPSRSKNGQK